MATATFTAREAYDTDGVFRALVNEWVECRRCPAPLVDRCLDFDMESAADCARWASSEPEREPVDPIAEKHGERGGECGPYPACNCDVEPDWVWFSPETASPPIHAFDLPHDMNSNREGHLTPTAAILWLLDNWLPAPASQE